jgi:hypothetical protein
MKSNFGWSSERKDLVGENFWIRRKVAAEKLTCGGFRWSLRR